MRQNISAIEFLEPKLNRQLQTYQPANNSKSYRIPNSKHLLELKLNVAQPFGNLSDDAAFIRLIFGDKGDAEPQIGFCVIPRDRRNQLLGDEPLRNIFCSRKV